MSDGFIKKERIIDNLAALLMPHGIFKKSRKFVLVYITKKKFIGDSNKNMIICGSFWQFINKP